ncbi:hypothetical protein SETIT_7G094700v2 [Setaria italica]|uniref:Uncharacterized protein n=1 Tax=Setaria italica TaxID=4555 RepID=A0A368RTL8_SETIT|nr:hypothetical protein SETIT_7G094700v2 [Setaria italica]
MLLLATTLYDPLQSCNGFISAVVWIILYSYNSKGEANDKQT